MKGKIDLENLSPVDLIMLAKWTQDEITGCKDAPAETDANDKTEWNG